MIKNNMRIDDIKKKIVELKEKEMIYILLRILVFLIVLQGEWFKLTT